MGYFNSTYNLLYNIFEVHKDQGSISLSGTTFSSKDTQGYFSDFSTSQFIEKIVPWRKGRVIKLGVSSTAR